MFSNYLLQYLSLMIIYFLNPIITRDYARKVNKAFYLIFIVISVMFLLFSLSCHYMKDCCTNVTNFFPNLANFYPDWANFCPDLTKFCPDFQSLHVRDIVRDSLEKDPVDRAPEDIEILLEFTQKLEAFNHMTMAVRRALCSGKNVLLLVHLNYS